MKVHTNEAVVFKYNLICLCIFVQCILCVLIIGTTLQLYLKCFISMGKAQIFVHTTEILKYDNMIQRK